MGAFFMTDLVVLAMLSTSSKGYCYVCCLESLYVSLNVCNNFVWTGVRSGSNCFVFQPLSERENNDKIFKGFREKMSPMLSSCCNQEHFFLDHLNKMPDVVTKQEIVSRKLIWVGLIS